jgi:chromosome partitioning protein
MILLFGGEKGGTGKSMMAVNIATIMAHEGREVILIDADKQSTTANWVANRDDEGVTPRIPCFQKYGPKLYLDIQSIAEKYENIIIDVGGRDTPELRAAMVISDVLFSPLAPALFDAETVPKLETIIREIKLNVNQDLKAYAFINKANPYTNEKQDLIEFFSEMESSELKLANTIITDYIAYRAASRYGKGVIELPRKEGRKAIIEIMKLYKEIQEVYNE